MSLEQKIRQSIELLNEVVEKRGAYSQDHLQHAENVINNASERAKKVTENLEEVLVEMKKGDSCGLYVPTVAETAHKLDEAFRSKHPMKVLETTMKKHDTVLRRLGNRYTSVWDYLGISEEEFKRRVVYGSCMKCGQTARSKDSCLCLAHTRGYHKWRNHRGVRR